MTAPPVFVCGFPFDDTRNIVALIHKTKGPDIVVGRLNGIGGKIEPGEHCLDAMRRECIEETGVDVVQWEHFAYLSADSTGFFAVWFFRAFLPWRQLREMKTAESERVELVTIAALPTRIVVPNLRWLIPLALDVTSTPPGGLRIGRAL